MTLYHMLRCVAFTLTLVATQRNARIDSDLILAFLYVASLRLIAKKLLKQIFAFRKLAQRKDLRHIVNRPLRFRLMLTLKNNAACVYMGNFRL